MNQDELKQLISELALDDELPIKSLPEIDLYMDQVTSLFDTYLNCYRRTPEDKLLTKSMINNYSKKKLLGTVNKKKYNKGQLLMIYLIFQLKQVATIDDIQHLFSAMTDDNGVVNTDTLFTYLPYLKALKAEDVRQFNTQIPTSLDAVNNIIKKESCDTSSAPQDSMLFALSLYDQALNYKRLADKLIDSIHEN